MSGPHCLWIQEGYRARRGGGHPEQVQGWGSRRPWSLPFTAALEPCQCFPSEICSNAPFPPLFCTVCLPKPLFFLNLFQPHVLHFATTLGLYPSRAGSANPHASSFAARLLRVGVTFPSHPQSPGNREIGLESKSSFRVCFSFQSLCCLKLEARRD